MISKFFKKSFSIRRFGGNNHNIFLGRGKFGKFLFQHIVFNANQLFFETKEQVNFFKNIFKVPIIWFPNNRAVPNSIHQKTNISAKKFIFIGFVCPEKGINELIRAFSSLRKDISLDIYGNDMMDILTKISNSYNIRYRGVFSNKQIYSILEEYDALILPSYEEGYPGVIIEAIMIGIPIISTKLPSIQEIIQHKKNGFLIEPRSSEELGMAIKEFNSNSKLYLSIRKNLLQEREKFSSKNWSNMFLDSILHLHTKL